MTIEEAKKYLNNYKYHKKNLVLIELKIQELERLAEGNGGMVISDTPGCQGGVKKSMKDFVNEIADLRQRYQEKYLKAEKVCEELEEQIYKVGETDVVYGQILSLYYIYNLTLLEIAKEINYGYRHTKRLFFEAIKRFASIFSKDVPQCPLSS